MPQHDVAIYSPFASQFFERRREPMGGGAEIQMTMLSRGLVAEGLRVALIVYPRRDPARPRHGDPDLIERGPHARDRPGMRQAHEASRIWRALAAADAAVYVVRGGGPHLLVVASFCRLHRRRLVFSAALDLDFDFTRPDRSRSHVLANRTALRRVDLVVVQREQQRRLAEAAGLAPLVTIPSLAEPAEAAADEPEALLWIGRLVHYKRPLAFVRLAASLREIPFRMVYFDDEGGGAEVEAAAAAVPNLEMLGQLPRPQVLEQLGRAVALVSTSAAEGMPNVFLEAWARAVPVASLKYDPDGKIAEEELGAVTGGSEERLREMVAELWSDRELRDRLGANGRRYVRETHWPEVVSHHWATALRELVDAG